MNHERLTREEREATSGTRSVNPFLVQSLRNYGNEFEPVLTAEPGDNRIASNLGCGSRWTPARAGSL